MPIYRHGKKVTNLYHNNKTIAQVYHKGHLVYSSRQGWLKTGTLRLTVNANSGNSIAGTIDFDRYDYYEGAAITKTYYEVTGRSLSRETEGVVSINLPQGSNIVFGSAVNSAEYPVPATGTITLSASEFYHIFRINKNDGVLNLTTQTLTSKYLEPIQDMILSKLGLGLYLDRGWAIANNINSRLRVSSGITEYALNFPSGDGFWPVYAVAYSGTEAEVLFLTCSQTAHYIYDNQNIRHVGWITVQDGVITSVTSFGNTTTGEMSKAISGTNLVVTGGYATDTAGYRVYVPGFTYSYSAMIDSAKDKRTVGAYQTKINTEEQQGSTTQGAQFSGSSLTSAYWAGPSFSWWSTISGPCMIKIRSGVGRASSTFDFQGCENTAFRFYTNSSLSYTDPSGYIDRSVNNISANVWTEQEIPSGTNVYAITRASNMGSCKYGPYIRYTGVQVATITETQGTRQVTTVYAKVTRNQSNNSKSVSSQTSTGTSVPYVSYVQIGTITVERNGTSGTLS